MLDSLSGRGIHSQLQIKERERLSVKTNVISAGRQRTSGERGSYWRTFPGT